MENTALTNVEEILNERLSGRYIRLYHTTWQSAYSEKRKGYFTETIETTKPTDIKSNRNYDRKRVHECVVKEYEIKDVSIMIDECGNSELYIDLKEFINKSTWHEHLKTVFIMNLFNNIEII